MIKTDSKRFTAGDAFSNLCKTYGIVVFKDPASSVFFIQAKNYPQRFLNAALFGRDTNVIPVIQFNDIPFTQALKEMGQKAKIDYILDARIRFDTQNVYGGMSAEPRLSLRWQNLTATQAFIAICEHFGLNVVKYPISGIIRVEPAD
jgi:hypothetical protein